MLRELGPLLESVLIVSQARVGQLTGGQLRAKVMAAEGTKCVRCWRWTKDVGANGKHPELCGRCAEVIEHIMGSKA